jgi:DNA polymerase I
MVGGLDVSILFVDIETKGGGVFGELQKLWCVSFGYSTSVETLVFKDYDVEQVRDSAEGQYLQYLLLENTCVFHNAAFDVTVLRQLGFRVPSFEDTMVLSYVCDPNREAIAGARHSLKAWGQRLGMDKQTIKEGGFDEWDSVLIVRCESDVKITRALYQHLLPILLADSRLHKYYTEVERPLIDVLIRMGGAGIPVNREELARVNDNLASTLVELQAELKKIAGAVPTGKKYYKREHPEMSPANPPYRSHKGRLEYVYQIFGEYNPNSCDQTSWVLQRDGWRPKKFTENGKPSVSSGVLCGVDHPLAKTKLEYNSLNKLYTSFGLTLEERLQGDGRVRPLWNQCVTKTGRLSSSKPNMLNLPARTELGAQFRKCVVAPHGYLVVAMDLQAIEYRLLAHFMHVWAKETKGYVPFDIQTMLHCFNCDPNTPEGDIHTQMAILWQPAQYVLDPNGTRKRCKAVSFGNMYGLGASKLAETIGVSVAAAKTLLREVHSRSQSMFEFKQYVWYSYRDNGGWMYSLLGHRLHYPALTWDTPAVTDEQVALIKGQERQGFNALMQGSCADIIKKLMIEFDKLAPDYGAILINSIYDELVYLVPSDSAESWAQIISVKDYDTLDGVPIFGNAGVGNNWLEAKQ